MSHRPKIHRKSKPEKFTVIDNEIFNDSAMSLKATGMLCLLLSLPVDWEIYLHDLKNRKTDGRDSVATAIQELIRLGYVTRIDVRKSGQFKGYDYEVFESPKTDIPETVIPNTENPQLLSTKSKKELTKQLLISKESFIRGVQEFNPGLPQEQLDKFVRHWTETDGRGKMKFEKQTTWETPGRLRIWKDNFETNFGRNPKKNKPVVSSSFQNANDQIGRVVEKLKDNEQPSS